MICKYDLIRSLVKKFFIDLRIDDELITNDYIMVPYISSKLES